MAIKKSVAVIGAGMAGLAAANRLCAAGMEVKLFEANDKVGGCCATTRIDGYTFNDGAVYLIMPQMLDHLFKALGLDRPSLLPLRNTSAIQSSTLPDGTLVDIGNGPGIVVNSLRGDVDTARANREVKDFLARWDPALRFFEDDVLVRPFSLSHLLIKGWRHLAGLRGTVASQLKDSFSIEAVRAALGGALLYAGVPSDKLPAAALLGLVSMLRDGYFLPEGGMGRIPEVLCDAVRARGGSIHLNAAIRRILVRNGRAHGIDVEGQGEVEVDAIVSTVSAMHTCGTLLSKDDAPPGMTRKMQRTPLSHKGFVLQLGLANRIEARSHANCVIPWLDEQSQYFQITGGHMRWSTYMVPTVTMPELAPSGCSVVEMFPPVSQDMAPGDWGEERKDEIVSKAVETLRREHDIEIAVSRVLSPREFQDNAHLFGGALYGLSPTAGPGALFKHRTPIRALYQAGQTTWPGFGVVAAGMSGVFAADALLRDDFRR